MWVRQADERATHPQADPPQMKESIPALFRDVTDSLVELVASHIKLTNLELVADLDLRIRQLGYQLVVCVAGLLGYGLLMVGLVLAVPPLMGLALAFALLGALHLVAAGIALLVLSRRHQHPVQIDRALRSMGKSVTVVADAVLGAPDHPHASN
jgi:hypothetical protein